MYDRDEVFRMVLVCKGVGHLVNLYLAKSLRPCHQAPVIGEMG